MEHNTDWREMRELIKRTGLTQEKIAQELGVSLRTVSYLVSPSRRHKVDSVLKYALEQRVSLRTGRRLNDGGKHAGGKLLSKIVNPIKDC